MATLIQFLQNYLESKDSMLLNRLFGYIDLGNQQGTIY